MGQCAADGTNLHRGEVPRSSRRHLSYRSPDDPRRAIESRSTWQSDAMPATATIGVPRRNSTLWTSVLGCRNPVARERATNKRRRRLDDGLCRARTCGCDVRYCVPAHRDAGCQKEARRESSGTHLDGVHQMGRTHCDVMCMGEQHDPRLLSCPRAPNRSCYERLSASDRSTPRCCCVNSSGQISGSSVIRLAYGFTCPRPWIVHLH